jgi:hypothetical protein
LLNISRAGTKAQSERKRKEKSYIITSSFQLLADLHIHKQYNNDDDDDNGKQQARRKREEKNPCYTENGVHIGT